MNGLYLASKIGPTLTIADDGILNIDNEFKSLGVAIVYPALFVLWHVNLSSNPTFRQVNNNRGDATAAIASADFVLFPNTYFPLVVEGPGSGAFLISGNNVQFNLTLVSSTAFMIGTDVV